MHSIQSSAYPYEVGGLGGVVSPNAKQKNKLFVHSVDLQNSPQLGIVH